jgi:hypothetical protein
MSRDVHSHFTQLKSLVGRDDRFVSVQCPFKRKPCFQNFNPHNFAMAVADGALHCHVRAAPAEVSAREWRAVSTPWHPTHIHARRGRPQNAQNAQHLEEGGHGSRTGSQTLAAVG